MERQVTRFESFDHYVDTLFAYILTIERHNEDKKVTPLSGVMYIGDSRLGRPTAQASTSGPSNITAALERGEKHQHTASKNLDNRCFNFWTPGFSIEFCKNPTQCPHKAKPRRVKAISWFSCAFHSYSDLGNINIYPELSH